MNTIFIVMTLVVHYRADWLLIDTSFSDSSISDNDWIFTKSCSGGGGGGPSGGGGWGGWCNSQVTPFNQGTCSTNQLSFAELQNNIDLLSKQFSYKSYQVRVIFDAFFNFTDAMQDSTLNVMYNESTTKTLLYQRRYKDSDLVQQSNRVCQSVADHEFDYNTIINTTVTNYAEQFSISFSFDSRNWQASIGLRNVLVYANACFPRCASCTTNSNQCSTCYYGSPTSNTCQCDPSHQFAQTAIGCRQECERDYYIQNTDLICVSDRRISSKYTYFNQSSIQSSDYERYLPFYFIPDPFHPTNIDRIYGGCSGIDFVGEQFYNEGFSLQLDEINALKFIRLRMNLYLFNLQTNSKLQITLDDVIQSEIKQTSTTFSFINTVNILNSTGSCNSKSYTLIRVETILKAYTLNPVLVIQGYLNSASESWGFRNVTIDVGLCSENCEVCSGFYTCQQCATGYILYQQGCVVSCPVYSTNCIDYSDEYPYSRYLAKGFYDLNMTIEDIEGYYDSFVTPSTNFITGQIFSFFPNKFVLGGMLVWFDATYTKAFSISKPHYAVSIRFNLTFGDSYPGQFSYSIDSVWSSNYASPSSGGSNILGKASNEKTMFFYIYQNPHTSNTLNIQFKCTKSTGLDIRDAFCAISEYFIVVHYCSPFCLVCSSATSCSSWQGTATSSSCAANQYLEFDSGTQTYSCNNCAQPGCTSCISSNECTSCTYTASNKFYLANGVCLCYPFSYLSGTICTACNKYCENCNGPSQNNCLTCVPEFHRSISNNYCLCEPGYYDDGHNLPCLPICGDGLVVYGEDCDDTNNNPFDGCYMCKYTCDQECDVCANGICESCVIGYNLIGNHCFAICHDNLLQIVEECEDNNHFPNTNCLNCKYQCPFGCILCSFGICQKCDETAGWYLHSDNTCQSICGDSIITITETCEDWNLVPFDRCDNCQIQCGLNCNQCAVGFCLSCEDGYILTEKTNECISLCGDSILTLKEECEDDNNLPYDGCYNCHISCQSPCTKCNFNGCSECNTLGWELNEILSICQPICGDGIVVPNYEECDDTLSVNCKQCKFECQDSCVQCYQGKCKQCKKGWNVNKLDETCSTITGDSLVLGSEQCDDKNQLDYDGCYKSQYSCQLSCEVCVKGICTICQTGYIDFQGKCVEITNDGITIGYEQCDDQNLSAQDGCFNNKYDCPQYCQSCVQGQCQKCKSGYGYLNNNQCLAICGDGIVALTEQCDDGNTKPYDGCFNCNYQCHPQCSLCVKGKCKKCYEGYYLKQNKCISVCGDEIVTIEEQCDDDNQNLSDGCAECKFTCHQQCSACVQGLCYDCIGIGWQINVAARDCQPICGDGIVLGNEQCDDGNNIPEDGCYECYFECQKQCTKCVQGYCQECNTIGWELIWNQCYPICGDKITIQDYEDCDDGNLIPYDGCFECKYQCQEQCTDCKLGICYACEVKGWKISNNLCLTDCGDSFVVYGYEDCDDGNDIQFDGCYQCQYECEELCTNCYQGICYECDYLGWIIDNHKCTPYCGDGLIVGYEQCDDMNTDFEDGCDKCMFVCDQYCIDCQEGICMQCELGRYIKSNICVAQCGDGFYVDSAEKCDDGNDDDHDGCNSNCQIETDWFCQNDPGHASGCFYSQQPQFKLLLTTSSPEDVEVVQLSFNQEMKQSPNVKDTILNYITFDITNLENNGFSITPSLDSPLTSNQISLITVSVKINFYVPVDNPILEVKFLNDPVLSQYNLTLKESQGTLQLATPMVLSQAQKAVAESASSFNQGMIYSLITVSSLCLLTGSSELFWNLMDQLQYLSYIKYINIQFPNNLNIYFNVFKLVTVSPLLTTLGIDQIFGMMDGSADYFVPTTNKFLKDETNGYFFTNFQSSLLVLVGGFSGYWITKYLHLFLYTLGPYHMKGLGFVISKFLYGLRKQLKQKAKQFYYNGLLRIVLSNCYDVSFSCAIQIANYLGGSDVLIINYYCAILILIVQAGFSLYLMGVTSKFSCASTLRSKEQYEELFEGIFQKKAVWAVQYHSIMLIKKQLFIYLIVFMQQDGSIQSISIGFIQTLFLMYLILNKPLTNQYEYYKSLITETLIIFNAVTFIFYAFRVEMNLTLAGSINLGWVHIFTSTSILMVSLIFDLIQQVKIVFNKIKLAIFGPVKEKENEIILFY